MRSVFSSESAKKDVQLSSADVPALVGWRAAWRTLVAGVRRAFAQAGHDAANVCFPSECEICDGPLLKVARVAVCESCLEEPAAGAQAANPCPRCGVAQGWESARMAQSLGYAECTLCRLAPPEFARAVSYAEYGDRLRDLLFLLKYQQRRETASHLLGARLAQAVLTLRAEAAGELLVVPVPLYFDRERERGYNQSVLLAEGAVKRLRTLAPEWTLQVADNVMVRVKATPALYSLSAKERRTRLAGAFKVLAPEMVAGREVLLIDDIMTTGATARECARVLRRAGAAKVWVATVARTQPHGTAWSEDGAIAGPRLPAGVAMWDGGTAPGMH